MVTKTKTRRNRVSKAEIIKAREQLLKSAPVKQTIEKMNTQPKWGKDFWLSDRFPDNYGDDIYFDSYGIAWGIDTDKQNKCVGKTEDVLTIIRGEKPILDNACPHTKRVLSKLLKDREEQDGRDKITPRTPSLQRGRPARVLGDRKKRTRPPKTRKGLPVHLPQQ